MINMSLTDKNEVELITQKFDLVVVDEQTMQCLMVMTNIFDKEI